MCYAEIVFNGDYDITVTQRTMYSKAIWNYNSKYDGKTKFEFLKEKIEVFLNSNTIENDLFKYCTNINKVIIPEGVCAIGNNAFDTCMHLENVTFPKSLKTIGDHAFTGTFLDNVTLPEGVEYIGESCFARSKIIKISIPNIDVVNISTFFGCSELEYVSLAEGITVIDALSFFGCHKLKNIKLSSTLNRIGEFAFAECNSLEEIELPDNIISIGMCAFQNCKNLKKIKYKGKAYTDKDTFNKMLKAVGITNKNNERIWI